MKTNLFQFPYFYSQSFKSIEVSARQDKRKELRGEPRFNFCKDPKALGINLTPTLDEYCNPGLNTEILTERNRDQVLYRYLDGLLANENASAEDRAKNLRLVTVPQIWSLSLDGACIIGMPDPLFEGEEFDMDRNWHDYALKCIKDGKTQEGYAYVQNTTQSPSVFTADLATPEVLIALNMALCVSTLERPYTAGLKEPVFNIFEKAISQISEQVKDYLKSITMDDIDIKLEKQFLHEIADIREELSMIRSVLFQQEEIWRDFSYKAMPAELWPNGRDGRFTFPQKVLDQGPFDFGGIDEFWIFERLERPQQLFPKYNRRITKLDEDAERVERSILVQLDLKAKHASLKESHSTAVMSAAVIGFTVITIIFTPLAFLASLLALPIDRFQKGQVSSAGGNNFFRSSYIARWMSEFNCPYDDICLQAQ
jgi:hypothetical protein